ncbi:MAG: restriction endonuclease subunit S [Bacteroidales bacterium]|nr:restriction endonuclease subunit S [Bacteroidales bacterium]
MRFPGFSDGWKEIQLHHLGVIVGGGTPDTSYKEYWNCGSIQWFTPSEVGKEKYVSLSERQITASGLQNSSAKLLPAGSILLSSRATVGECSINLAECCTNQGFQSFIPNKSIVGTEFLYYRLQTLKRVFIRKACGSTFLEISASQIAKIWSFIPQEKEQNKIASFLSLIDQRIALQNKVIEDLRTLKKAIMARLFHSSDGEMKTLGDLTVNFSNRNKQRIPYPMFSVTNDKGFIPQSEQFEDREMEGEDIAAYKLIQAGDIAYNPARINVGSIAQYKGKTTCMISSLYVCIQAKRTVSDRWLMHILKSERLLYYYNLYAEGGVRLYLFYPNFSRIKVFVPPYAKQERIADCLDAIEKKVEQESVLLNDLMKQKQFFLSRLFL